MEEGFLSAEDVDPLIASCGSKFKLFFFLVSVVFSVRNFFLTSFHSVNVGTLCLKSA